MKAAFQIILATINHSHSRLDGQGLVAMAGEDEAWCKSWLQFDAMVTQVAALKARKGQRPVQDALKGDNPPVVVKSKSAGSRLYLSCCDLDLISIVIVFCNRDY